MGKVLIMYKGRLEHSTADPMLKKHGDGYKKFKSYSFEENWNNQCKFLIDPVKNDNTVFIAIY
tara:strand:+ start:171 stop:359 length:189 start_codon:yes stop_codon:yes gene_type:complete